MKTMTVGLFLIATLTLAPRPAAAHPGHTHKVMGTIAVIAPTRLEVVDTAGAKSAFAMTKDTKVVIGTDPATVADIKIGMRVVVEAIELADGKAEAKVVRLPARPK